MIILFQNKMFFSTGFISVQSQLPVGFLSRYSDKSEYILTYLFYSFARKRLK